MSNKAILPLVGIGLVMFALSKKAKAQPKPKPTEAEALSDAEVTAWAVDLRVALDEAGAASDIVLSPQQIRELVEMNREGGAMGALGVANVKAAIAQGIPPTVESFCLAMAGKIEGMAPVWPMVELRKRWPAATELIEEICGRD